MAASKARIFDVSKSFQGVIPNCPICQASNASFVGKDEGGLKVLQGWCPACSNVSITSESIEEVKRGSKAHLLSAYLRRLPSESWTLEIGGVIACGDLDRLTSAISELTILEQFDQALKLVCEQCLVIGGPSTFAYATDWPLLTVRSAEAALNILMELARAGYLLEDETKSGVVPSRPTLKAYERLQNLQASGRVSEIGFVAMSFSPSRLAFWKDVIKPAILEAGYRPFRVDQYEHNSRIDDEIIAGIKRSRFLVADFTEQKKGVYFEAGLALGLGRNVVWMCHSSEVSELHFDTRQFNHILYDDEGAAKEALTNRIVSLEGQGAFVLALE